MTTRSQGLLVRTPDGGGELTAALGDAGVDLVIAESVEAVGKALEDHAVQCVVSPGDVSSSET